MGIDQNEARRQRTADSPKTKYSSKPPIAAIEKRVIDSPVFAKLPASSVVILLLLARNLEKDRNGHVFLSAEDAEKHGVDSKVLYRQLKTLVALGFIYPTTRGGHGKCARYALTWLSLSKDTKGLNVENFKPFKYRDLDPELIEWKKRRGKVSSSTGQISRQPSKLEDRNPASLPDKDPYVEVNTNTHGEAQRQAAVMANVKWIPDYLSNLSRAGLDSHQCFAISQGRTLQ